jgi:DegV family protein with EDD domain
MRPIGILTDSNSSIDQTLAAGLDIRVLPMPFEIDGKPCREGIDLQRGEFLAHLEKGAQVSTSQPSPADVMAFWDEALTQFETVVYIPISSGLSGSCATAMALSQEEPYENRVFVVDNGRVATPQHRSVLDALEMVQEGYTAGQIKTMLEADRDKMVIYVGLKTVEYLKRGGRLTPSAAAIATVLHIRPVLRFDTGILEPYKKCQGFKRVRRAMIEAMKQDLETRFKPWYDRGEVSLLAASSASPEETASWVQEIEEAFPGLPVLCDDLSLGVSCHIGPGGLGIGCSCKPARL